MAISTENVVVASEEHVSADLDSESVILSLKNGTYYGLDPLGAHIWELIQEPRQVLEVRDAILSEYDVGAEQCETDLIALLDQLKSEGLIEVKSGAIA